MGVVPTRKTLNAKLAKAISIVQADLRKQINDALAALPAGASAAKQNATVAGVALAFVTEK